MLFNLLETTTDQASKGDPTTTYIIFGVLIALMVVFFIYSHISNKKRQKKAQEMVDSIKVGDKMKTIGGICGTVYEINDEQGTIVLETGTDAYKSYIKFDKAAIYQVGEAAEQSVNNATK